MHSLFYSSYITLKPIFEVPMQDKNRENNIETFPIGMSYVPWQTLCTIYENLEQAYKIGTIFPDLNKPFTGRRKPK